MIYVGQKVWIMPSVRARVVEIMDDDIAIVQEDHRIRVDGTRKHPIYEYARNGNGKTHTIILGD